jgi:uncharacterized protein
MSASISVTSTEAFRLDLGTNLFTSQRAFEDQIEDRFVVFAPDHLGLPVVASRWVHELFHAFDDGAVVGDVLANHQAAQGRVDDAIEAIGFLEGAGFLSTLPTPERYSVPDHSGSSPRAFSIWLHLNNNCNLDCSYCFVDKFKARMTRDVQRETIRRIVDTAANHDVRQIVLKFAGGEPTLSLPDMEWFHAELSEQLARINVKLSTAILTNGTNVSTRLIEFIKRNNVSVSISLDGYGAEFHDLYRIYKNTGRGSWDRIVSNIDKLQANSIHPYILATISERTAPSLPDLVRWIYSRGLRARLGVVRQPAESSFTENGYDRPIQSGQLVTIKRRNEKSQPESFASIQTRYLPLVNTMKEAFEKAFTELEHPDFRIDLRNGMNICELHFDSPVMTACCGIGSTHVVIQEDGKVASCPMTLRNTEVEPGSDLLKAAQQTFRISPQIRNSCEEKNCLDCRWFPVCVSGCPVNNERMTGSPFTISPLHEFYQYVIPRYVRFFGIKLLQEARRQGADASWLLAA